MKKILLIFFLLAITICNSQNVFIDEKPKDEITAMEFPKKTKSIIFFGEKDISQTYKNHKKGELEVNAFFGASYDNFVIANILSKNIVVYNNRKDKFIFYRLNAEQEFGVIISDGKNKPIVIYEPKLYLESVKKYLKIENADQVVPKSENEKNTSEYVKEMNRIMSLNFEINQNYADLIINNSNTVHYIKPKKDEENCKYKKRKFEVFQDEAMTLKASYGANYYYDKKNRLIKLENMVNDSITDVLNYQTDEFGLLTYLKNKNNELVTAVYIYQIDKFYVVYLEDEEPISYETFYLNDKKQCINRTSYREDKSVVIDIKYFYDNFNRVIKEIDDDVETIYSYKNNTNDYYSKLIRRTVSDKKIISEYNLSRLKSFNFFEEKNESGKVINTSKTITNLNCDTQTYLYDQNKKLQSVMTFKTID